MRSPESPELGSKPAGALDFEIELRFAIERGRLPRGERIEPALGDRDGEADELARELHRLDSRERQLALWGRELGRRDHVRLLALRRWRRSLSR